MLLQDHTDGLQRWQPGQVSTINPNAHAEWARWPDAQDARTVLGACDLSRTVITGWVDGPVGFACTSLALLSVNPPLLSFTPARTALTWAQLRRSGQFCVNVLSADQKACFSKFSQLATDRFEGVLWTTSPGGYPVLMGATAWADCRVRAEYDGGDHRIVVCDVFALARGVAYLPAPFLRSSYGS